MTCGLLALIAWFFGLPFALVGSLFLTRIAPPELPLSIVDPSSEPALRVVYRTDAAPAVEAQAVLARRLANFGINGASVTLEGADRLVVLLPAVDEGVITDLGRRGSLELVDLSGVGGQIMDGERLQTGLNSDGMLNPLTGAPFETILANSGIASASAQMNSVTGQWQVVVTFTTEDSEMMRTFTRAHIGEPLGIVLDGELLIAPVIQAEVSESAMITIVGGEAAARRLAALITAGVLPAPLIVEEIGTVGE